MTIHTEHPFDTPDDERDPVRRLRGRIGGTVSLWTSGEGIERAGLTVSSFLVATGDPGRVVGLLPPAPARPAHLDKPGPPAGGWGSRTPTPTCSTSWSRPAPRSSACSGRATRGWRTPSPGSCRLP